MIRRIEKNEIRERIHERIRQKMRGTAERPRLAVYRSVAHIYAQVIDDAQGRTVVSASSVEKGNRTNGGNIAAAKAIGKAVAERAKEKGIKQVVFDRGGYQYHGRVKALAEAAREAGLEF
ncbi:MAG TPA: 50S ribosomal protein L18 [Bryobacteraceae bacterium]